MSAVRLALLCCFGMVGCVSMPDDAMRLPGGAEPIELAETPFFPQRDYQCGPAALNTVLVASGASSTVDSLVDLVYLPANRGSLQAEMLAATRSQNRIPYPVDADIAAIYEELGANRPVLVLQNLGIKALPRWHYAVVIGVDPELNQVYLRSGIDERRAMNTKTFMRTWQRSNYWGFVALKAGELPARPDVDRFARAVTAMESVGQQTVANESWRAALGQWPENSLVNFGAAGVEYAAGNYDAAAVLYKKIVLADPDHLFARNNLAMTLARQGRVSEASSTISSALKEAADQTAIKQLLLQTATEIEQLQ